MRTLVLLSCIAALVPLAASRAPVSAEAGAEFAWPLTLDGRELVRREISADEARFAADFPGALGRFTDGEREILIRAVRAPTRGLHQSSDCFRGMGYSVTELPLRRGRDNSVWSCFRARGKRILRVCEQIAGRDGTTFSDVSAWYWAAALGRSSGPWLAYTVVSVESGEGTQTS
jgi:hypothetical protein